MAAPSLKFIAALRRHGAESPANKQQLQEWKSAALTAVAENGGGDISSGSGNGVAFAKMIGGGTMTNAEWFTALDEALQYIAAGIAPSSRTLGRVI